MRLVRGLCPSKTVSEGGTQSSSERCNYGLIIAFSFFMCSISIVTYILPSEEINWKGFSYRTEIAFAF
jgi:hypothetical protein